MKTEFMLRLEQKLGDEYGVSDASDTIRALEVLNEGKPFRTLAFLKKHELIEAKLDKLSVKARARVLSMITAVLEGKAREDWEQRLQIAVVPEINQSESPCPPG